MVILSMIGCDVDLHDREICTYTVQLRYDYNEENTTQENKVRLWVKIIDEYIFDDDEILYSIRRVTEEMCTENLDSELQLEAGKYSVLAIGNGDHRSLVYDSATGAAPVVGQTHREDIRLSLEGSDTYEDNSVGPCEELFHGYRTFTVRDTGASRIRVDMINAHFQLRFRVRWRNTRAAPGNGTYHAVLRDIPSRYAMMPEYIYPAGSLEAEDHDCDKHDDHPHTTNDAVHHIPKVTYAAENPLTHRHETYLTVDKEVWGQFVNYRVKRDTPLLMDLYVAPNSTRAEPDRILPRQIDLSAYFDWYGIDLDHELKQEYSLDILVDGDRIIITPMEGLSVADWTDGGTLH